MTMSAMFSDSFRARFSIAPRRTGGSGFARALLESIGIVVDQGLNIQQYVREFIGRMRDLLADEARIWMTKSSAAPKKRSALAARANSFRNRI